MRPRDTRGSDKATDAIGVEDGDDGAAAADADARLELGLVAHVELVQRRKQILRQQLLFVVVFGRENRPEQRARRRRRDRCATETRQTPPQSCGNKRSVNK